jgi:hypothetical protein
LIILVDFDGVLHSYEQAWQGPDVIPDAPVEGAFDFLKDLIAARMEVNIYSARSRYPEGVVAMKAWFRQHRFEYVDYLEFPTEKPAAFLTIDDRCIRFEGTFPTVDEIENFKPWNKRGI